MAIATKACSPLLIRSMEAQKPAPPSSKTVSSKKRSTMCPIGEPPWTAYTASGEQEKLLSRVEKLRLLSKAAKAGLLSPAEKAGLSLSSLEKFSLLSKAEEFGVLSVATDPGTPSSLLSLSLFLLVLGTACAYLVPEDYPWEEKGCAR